MPPRGEVRRASAVSGASQDRAGGNAHPPTRDGLRIRRRRAHGAAVRRGGFGGLDLGRAGRDAVRGRLRVGAFRTRGCPPFVLGRLRRADRTPVHYRHPRPPPPTPLPP
ncbi:hypothetical protein GCM10020000_27590 [Streptomyces olivoverticillatus]